MQLSVFGQTDKRPVFYSFMLICQKMGDTAIITNNRQYTRLLDGEYTGYYQNIFIGVTDAAPDEIWEELNIAPDDFEFILYDNIYTGSGSVKADESKHIYTLYVQGAGLEEMDEDIREAFPNQPVIYMGSAPKKTGRFQPSEEADEEDEFAGLSAQAKKHIGKKATKADKRQEFVIPYSAGLMKSIEHIEYYKQLIPTCKEAMSICAKLLEKYTGTSAATLSKVVSTKK